MADAERYSPVEPIQKPLQSVCALYPYTYDDNGVVVSMNEGEVFHLLNSNSDGWWQVCRTDSPDPFYVPAAYVEIIDNTINRHSDSQATNSNNTDHDDYQNTAEFKQDNINIQQVTFRDKDQEDVKKYKTSVQIGSFKPQMEQDKQYNSESDKHNHDNGQPIYANYSNETTEQSKNDGIETEFGGDYVNLDDLRAAAGMAPPEVAAAEGDHSVLRPQGPNTTGDGMYANLEQIHGGIEMPPPYPENSKYEKTLMGTWDMYLDPLSNRVFYVHKETQERNWKPPRGTYHNELAKQRSDGSNKSQSPTSEKSDPFQGQGQQEKSSAYKASSTSTGSLERAHGSLDAGTSSIKPFSSFGSLERAKVPSSPEASSRFAKTRSVMIENLHFNLPSANTGPPPPKSATLPPNFSASIPEVPAHIQLLVDGYGIRKTSAPDLTESTRHYPQCVYLNEPIEGMLTKTKIINGKKEKGGKKNTYVKLAGSNLVFYKDQRSSQPTKAAPYGKYEEMVPLVTCTLEKDPKEFKSKKNTILIRTPDCQILLQHEDDVKIKEWFLKLHMKIQQVGGQPDNPQQETTIPAPEPGMKRKPSFKVGSRNPADVREKGRIREILGKFLTNRTPQNIVEEKGIYKDAVFGAELKQLCEKEKTKVPKFVTSCIAAIEKRGLHVEGLYRVSGNLATIQKLRCLVDQTSDYDLDDPKWDISVLSGALKMFFRELKEPVFTFDLFEKFLKGYLKQLKSERLKAIRSTMQELPKNNLETIKVLFKHLTRVIEHSSENKMGAQQLAIVISPNLIYPEQQTQNLATNVVYQGRIVEFIICEYKNIFR